MQQQNNWRSVSRLLLEPRFQRLEAQISMQTSWTHRLIENIAPARMRLSARVLQGPVSHSLLRGRHPLIS